MLVLFVFLKPLAIRRTIGIPICSGFVVLLVGLQIAFSLPLVFLLCLTFAVVVAILPLMSLNLSMLLQVGRPSFPVFDPVFREIDNISPRNRAILGPPEVVILVVYSYEPSRLRTHRLSFKLARFITSCFSITSRKFTNLPSATSSESCSRFRSVSCSNFRSSSFSLSSIGIVNYRIGWVSAASLSSSVRQARLSVLIVMESDAMLMSYSPIGFVFDLFCSGTGVSPDLHIVRYG